MHRLPLVLRIPLLFAFLAAPPVFSVWVIFGRLPAESVLIVIGFVWLLSLLLGQTLLLRRTQPRRPPAQTLLLTYSRAVAPRRVQLEWNHFPQLWIRPSPVPSALVCRSIGRQGAILVSQGLLDRLTEAELRKLLAYCVRRTGRMDTVFRTQGAALAALFMAFLPEEWMLRVWMQTEGPSEARRIGGATSLFRLLWFLPIQAAVRTLLRLSGGALDSASKDRLLAADPSYEWSNALRKTRLTPNSFVSPNEIPWVGLTFNPPTEAFSRFGPFS